MRSISACSNLLTSCCATSISPLPPDMASSSRLLHGIWHDNHFSKWQPFRSWSKTPNSASASMPITSAMRSLNRATRLRGIFGDKEGKKDGRRRDTLEEGATGPFGWKMSRWQPNQIPGCEDVAKASSAADKSHHYMRELEAIKKFRR
ncbi:hypothetical protein BDV12DRAFT_164125 [Aspergillus spectabilis]